MKKYSSYFNKRYFPEPDENSGEDTLPVDLMSESDELSSDPLSSLDVSEPSSIEDTTYESPIDSTVGSDIYNSSINVSAPPMPAPQPYNSVSSEYTPPVSSIASMPVAPASSADPEVTVISKSAVINGELTVAGDLRMYGKIKGNMTVHGNIEIVGKVIGNVSGNDVELSHCELKGDIASTGFVFMDKESIMIGNVSSQDITLDGKIKGDIAALNKVYIRSNAVVVGNVHANTIAIDEGAALQGQIVITTKEGNSLEIREDTSLEN